jgi:2-polyprenyl-3-methyl-5-hydroxy-6-metoxy-1,4-benzoquinol methylase
MTKKISRNNDVYSGKKDLELVHTIKNLPIKMGVTTQNTNDDEYLDLNCYISISSGMLQISPLIALEQLYSSGHGAGTVGETWQKHHIEFSEIIKKYSPKTILEIGGGHGRLAKINLSANDKTYLWKILEPSYDSFENTDDPRINYEKGYFDENFTEICYPYDAIVHSHLLEHIYDPNNFIKLSREILNENGLVILSIPNMEYMLKNKYCNAIMFEHTYYASEYYIKSMFEKNGFKLCKKSYFQNHSIFMVFKKYSSKMKNNLELEGLYEKNKKLYLTYINTLISFVAKTNLILEKNNDKNTFYLFGAHIFSQILLSLGLNSNRIKFVIDNDKNKIGKRLYGSNLIVKSSEILKTDKEPIIILNAGNYNKEIKDQITKNHCKNAKFLEV